MSRCYTEHGMCGCTLQPYRVPVCMCVYNLNAARRPPRPGRMLGGRHDARSGGFCFRRISGCSVCGVKSDRVCTDKLSLSLSIYIYYIYIYMYVYSVTAPARGGRRGGGEGGGSPNPWKEAKLHRRTLGLIYGFAQRDPPPPPRWCFRGVGVSGEGIKRWGIEGIRIGTSDRFHWGRGELCICDNPHSTLTQISFNRNPKP